MDNFIIDGFLSDQQVSKSVFGMHIQVHTSFYMQLIFSTFEAVSQDLVILVDRVMS